MTAIKLEPIDDLLEELSDGGLTQRLSANARNAKKLSSEIKKAVLERSDLLEQHFGSDEHSERVIRIQRRKTGIGSEKSGSAGGSLVCRLCCLAVSRLTNSVSDDVIADFLNFVPNLSLCDYQSLSPLVCQLCFSKAKICVDFIQKIKQAQHSLDSKSRISVRPVQSLLKKSPRVTAQDVLNKMKRIGGLNIKKVAVKRARLRDGDSDDNFSWPMEPNTKKTTALPKKITKTPLKKIKAYVQTDSDDDYQLDEASSDSDEGPSRSSSSRKRKSAMSDSDEVSQSSSKNSNRTKTEVLVAPPARYSCGKCKNYFKDLDSLLGHVKNKTCIGSGFACETCGKIYDTKSKLNSHKESHAEKVTVFCDQCGKELRDAFALEAHIEAVHKRVVRTDCVFRCSKCSDTFNSHLDLLNHVKVHKNSPTMPCDVCGKEVLKASYHSHMQWHKQDKSHACDTCGKTFYQKYQLRNHMHNHNGIKEFPCDYCDKTYANGNAKRRHIQMAHPEATPTARVFKYKQ